MIRRIYRLYLREHRGLADITRLLNHEGLLSERGTAWTEAQVKKVLTADKYTARMTFFRWRTVLGGGQVRVARYVEDRPGH